MRHKTEFAKHLGDSLKLLFPDQQIHKNARKLSQLVSPLTGRYLELDFWIPALKLGFEYQDPHHYVDWWFANVSNKNKLQFVEARGDTLIAIPFWWDQTLESLVATIKRRRPDLLREHKLSVAPIPTEPPAGVIKPGHEIPGVGSLMLATFFRAVLLAPLSWWMSEKYDGTRLCWLPHKRRLVSRNGIAVYLHDSFVRQMPGIILDCEFWFGRGTFEATQRLYFHVNKENLSSDTNTNDDTTPEDGSNTTNTTTRITNTPDPTVITNIEPAETTKTNKSSPLRELSEIPWETLRALVADFPAKENHTQKVEERLRGILKIDADHPFVKIPISNVMCKNKGHMRKFVRVVINEEGEGAVLKEAGSLYQTGRSSAFMKVKMERDQEALVVARGPDGYTLQLPDGVPFHAEYSSRQEHDALLPKSGDVVSFCYFRYGPSGPIDARILRVRTDVTWRDVVRGVRSDAQARSTNADTQSVVYTRDHVYMAENKHNARPHGYWSVNEGINIREFLDNYAKKDNMDPLLAETWYNLSIKDLQAAGVIGMARQFSSHYRMLASAYPTIQFDNSKFNTKYKGYWELTSNHKVYFDNIAKDNNFDPLIANNWYSFKIKYFLKRKGSRLLWSYNSSHITALTRVYPNIGLQPHLFQFLPKNHWTSKVNLKAFFDDYAAKEEFNPLVPENWYQTTTQRVLRKGGAGPLLRYSNSLASALVDVYPAIGWDEQKLRHVR